MQKARVRLYDRLPPYFQNISREIHDNIGQVLSLAKLNLSAINPNQPESLEQRINDSKNLVGQAIRDLRNLPHGLNTGSFFGFSRNL